jgi:fatty-acyl-CoA synthase
MHTLSERIGHAMGRNLGLSDGERALDGPGLMAAVELEARALQQRGVQAGQIVAWLGHNSLAMLFNLFACQQLGAVWMPLNWRLAQPELALQLQHAGAAHLCHGSGFEQACAALAVCLAPALGAAQGAQPGDTLLVYTSGTTGAPKGAMHTLAGVLANADAAIAAQGLDAGTRALCVLPLFHAGGLCIQTLPTLLAGGRVLLHTRFEPEAWFDEVQAWRPTTCLVVPAVMRALTLHPRWASADLSSLRFVTAGSQIVPTALIEAFHARGVAVAQVYGATETGPVSLVLRPDEALQHVGCVGRPALGVALRLGADGEIQLRAPNVMRAYHRSAEPSFDAEGWFHTGDLAVQHASGLYEVVGRSKELIISGGENIHPSEIEACVARRAEVAECAVVGLPDARWGEVPVLAVVLAPGAQLDAAALLAEMATQLARFKLPRRVLCLQALPKTALGKVQRAALAAQLQAMPDP